MRLFSALKATAGIVTLASLLTAGTPRAMAVVIYDAAKDFSLANNPNGVWSYGYETTLGGSLLLFDVATMDARSTPGLDSWTSSQLGVDPHVIHNRTNSDLTFGSVTVPAGGLQFHPGSLGQFTVIRWTAPAAGTYDLAVSFRGNDIRPTTTDVHVLDNGVSLFVGNVTAFGSGPSFTSTVSVASGDTIDFAVGFGADGNYFGDSTGIEATIRPASAAPEPSSLTLWGLSSAGLLGYARRRCANVTA